MTNPIIAVLAWLWRALFWIWTILVIGTAVGVLGTIGYNLITNTPMTFINPLTAPFIAGFRAQPLWSIVFLVAAVLLTVAAFLADRYQRREEERKNFGGTLLVSRRGGDPCGRPSLPKRTPPPCTQRALLGDRKGPHPTAHPPPPLRARYVQPLSYHNKPSPA